MPKKRKNFVNTHRKQGTGKLDSEGKNCANTFPRVRKQTLLFETGVCIDYVRFCISLSSYRLTVKLPCGSYIKCLEAPQTQNYETTDQLISLSERWLFFFMMGTCIESVSAADMTS